MPHALADVIRRLNSSIRSAVRATSMPPHVEFMSIATYWRWLSSVSSAISLLWSVGKMKLEAWPVEPPGLGNGTLVDLHEIGPAEAGEVADEAVADDPGADDHAPRLRRQRLARF